MHLQRVPKSRTGFVPGNRAAGAFPPRRSTRAQWRAAVVRRVAIGFAALTISLLHAWPAKAQVIVPTNAGFTTPTVASGNHVQRPTGASWTFVSTSGIEGNDPSHLDFGLTNSPTGQAGYVQRTGSFSQTVSGFTNAKYELTFLAEGSPVRTADHIQVKVDSTILTFGGSTSVLPTSTTSFTSFTSAPFQLAAGSHVLQFVGLDNTGNRVSFIVNPSFTVVTPEPSSLLLGFLVTSCGIAYYRKRVKGTKGEASARQRRASVDM